MPGWSLADDIAVLRPGCPLGDGDPPDREVAKPTIISALNLVRACTLNGIPLYNTYRVPVHLLLSPSRAHQTLRCLYFCNRFLHTCPSLLNFSLFKTAIGQRGFVCWRVHLLYNTGTGIGHKALFVCCLFGDSFVVSLGTDEVHCLFVCLFVCLSVWRFAVSKSGLVHKNIVKHIRLHKPSETRLSPD